MASIHTLMMQLFLFWAKSPSTTTKTIDHLFWILWKSSTHTHTHTQAITTNDHCDVTNGGGRFNIDGKWIITFIALDSLNMWRYNDCIDNIVWSLSFAHFSISSSSSLSFWFILAHTYNGQWSCANDFSMVHHHHQSNIISNEYRMLMFSSWLWRWWMMIVKWNKYSNRATN